MTTREDANGAINVYAGTGDDTLDAFEKHEDRTHGHFKIGGPGQPEDVYGRSGPQGSEPDYDSGFDTRTGAYRDK